MILTADHGEMGGAHKMRNDLELYDTEPDPDEMQNLAFDSEPQKARILELNTMLNQLVDEEVGLDDGSHMPGVASLWKS